jgi:hypothetical protein
VRVCLVVLALAAASSAFAQLSGPPAPFQGDFEEKPWEEQQTQLPAYPKPENLARVYVSASSSFEFFVDTASINIGKDGVVRYSLIARSPTGALNVSYEGIRCSSRERRLYAFGRRDDTWSKARKSEWGPIFGSQANRHHAALADEFFCPRRIIVRTAQEAVDALRRDGELNANPRGQLR